MSSIPETESTVGSSEGYDYRAANEIRFRLAKLILAIILVVVFIIVMGDLRRHNVPMMQAERFAEQLRQQQGETKTLPLNIRFELPPDLKTAFFSFTCLDRSEARVLRDLPGTVIMAYTRHVTRLLLSDGRAVLLFDNGNIEARWLSGREFDEIMEAQAKRLVGTERS